MDAHKLRSNAQGSRPSRVVFVDTETSATHSADGRTFHALRLGYAIACFTRRGVRLHPHSDIAFTDPAAFWDWLDRMVGGGTVVYLVAHNLNFDLPVLQTFSELPARGWKLESMYAKQTVGIYRWSAPDRKLIMLDNGNFFSGKLEKWGEIIKLPKLEVDFKAVNDADLLEYCKRDVFIMRDLWVAWLDFLDVHDCGKFGSTLAATAFNTYRYRFMPTSIWIDHTLEAAALERAAYRGGRVEVFYQGRRNSGNYHYIDVNSMYGFVMANNLYPAGLCGSAPCRSLAMLDRKLKKYAVIARVEVEVTEPWFPYVVNGYTAYPVGRFTTTLTTPELLLARQRNWIKKVEFIAYYRQAPLFNRYVNYFQHLKEQYQQTDQDAWAEISKLFINTLYGKFGQLGLYLSIIGECDPREVERMPVIDPVRRQRYTLTKLGGSVIKEQRQGENYNSAPAIAAHVTAYARLYLNSLRYLITPGHVFYMDTDSLITDNRGLADLAELMDPYAPGKLKIELTSPWLVVNAPKDYRMAGRVRSKGVKGDAVQTGKNQFEQENFARIRGLIHDGNVDQYYTRQVIKNLTREIHSGTVDRSGWVRPFLLDGERVAGLAPLRIARGQH